MLKNTQGLVLRNIKYGETSIISTIYTQHFGLQAYLIQGARSSRKSGIKANYFQIGQFLDLTVYYKSSKNLQRIKEVRLNAEHAILSQNIVRQSVAQYCCELILRCIKEEEENKSLYDFLSSFFMSLKDLKKEELAFAPIRFTILFASQLGFAINNNYSSELNIFDALNGEFCEHLANSSYTVRANISKNIAKAISENDTQSINYTERMAVLNSLLVFLKLQMPLMGDLKSVSILHQILQNE